MKKIYCLIFILIIASSYMLVRNTPLGTPNATVEALGGFKVDSGFQIPIWDTSKIWSGRGISSSDAVLVINSLDGNLCVLKNGHWVEVAGSGGGGGSLAIGQSITGGADSFVLFGLHGVLGVSSGLIYNGFNLKLGARETITMNDLRLNDLDGFSLINATPATIGIPVQKSPSFSMVGSAIDTFGDPYELQTFRMHWTPDATVDTPYLSFGVTTEDTSGLMGVESIFAKISKKGQWTTLNGYKTLSGNLLDNDGLSLIAGAAITYGAAGGGNSTSGDNTLSSGTVTVSTTAIQTGDMVLLTGISTATPCATCGNLSLGTIVDGTSFVINSSVNTDSRVVRWVILKRR